MFAKSILGIFFLSGCSNHCQLLCESMADYAKSECDINVGDSQIDTCIADFEDPSDKELEACETHAKIEDEKGWDCEVVSRYFDD